MPKFYAVRHGRTPGIYTTWTECEAQTKGYSGAIFKSFTKCTEAERFMGNEFETPIFVASAAAAYTSTSTSSSSSPSSSSTVLPIVATSTSSSSSPSSSSTVLPIVATSTSTSAPKSRRTTSRTSTWKPPPTRTIVSQPSLKLIHQSFHTNTNDDYATLQAYFSSPIRHAHLYSDGASRGNPGAASCGGVMYTAPISSSSSSTSHCILIYTFSIPLGIATNNEGEYCGLLEGLKAASKMGITHLTAYADSELMCRQISGDYAVRNTNLQSYHKQCLELISTFTSFSLEHVFRDQNSEADAQCNRALDSGQHMIWDIRDEMKLEIKEEVEEPSTSSSSSSTLKRAYPDSDPATFTLTSTSTSISTSPSSSTSLSSSTSTSDSTSTSESTSTTAPPAKRVRVESITDVRPKQTIVMD